MSTLRSVSRPDFNVEMIEKVVGLARRYTLRGRHDPSEKVQKGGVMNLEAIKSLCIRRRVCRCVARTKRKYRQPLLRPFPVEVCQG